jgi:hypothetical protein
VCHFVNLLTGRKFGLYEIGLGKFAALAFVFRESQVHKPPSKKVAAGWNITGVKNQPAAKTHMDFLKDLADGARLKDLFNTR